MDFKHGYLFVTIAPSFVFQRAGGFFQAELLMAGVIQLIVTEIIKLQASLSRPALEQHSSEFSFED